MTRLVVRIGTLTRTLVHSDEGRCLLDASVVCDMATLAVHEKSKSPEILMDGVCDRAIAVGWFPVDEEMKIDGDVQVYLTWITGWKGFDASIWDARNHQLVKYFTGPLAELTRSGRSHDIMLAAARKIGVVDVTEEYMREIQQ